MGLPDHARDRGGHGAADELAGERASLAALLGASSDQADAAAATLLARFGSVADVLNASREAVCAAVRDGAAIADQLGHLRVVLLHSLRKRLEARPLLSDEPALLEYLSFTMAHARTEAVRLLFLDSRNRLLRDEMLGMGSVGSVALHPREPVRRALELGATAIILVHNHPSGDPTPSRADVAATRRLAAAAALMDIRLHDHLIVAREGWTSLKRLGHL